MHAAQGEHECQCQASGQRCGQGRGTQGAKDEHTHQRGHEVAHHHRRLVEVDGFHRQPLDALGQRVGAAEQAFAQLRRVEAVEEVEASSEAVTADFDTNSVPEPVVSFNDVSPFDKPVEKFEPAATIGGMAPVNLTPVVEKVSVPTGSRLSDRNVDLPIEVADDERRLHNDARRFARLLVSEIKLYNEKKVQEGREANDLYERLREAIDRSREMYDKRVQPPVASKFDYFHYELVNSLAEGDIGRLGGSYPGATA